MKIIVQDSTGRNHVFIKEKLWMQQEGDHYTIFTERDRLPGEATGYDKPRKTIAMFCKPIFVRDYSEDYPTQASSLMPGHKP